MKGGGETYIPGPAPAMMAQPGGCAILPTVTGFEKDVSVKTSM